MTEMVRVLAPELDGEVAVHVGVDIRFDPEGVVIIKQGRDEIHILGDLWSRWLEETLPIVERGLGFVAARRSDAGAASE